MQKDIDIRVNPAQAASPDKLKQLFISQTNIPDDRIHSVRIIRRSIDARQRNIMVNLRLRGYVDEIPTETDFLPTQYPDVSDRPSALVIGAGPAGLFAALKLIEEGIRPIVIERGKDVRSRKRDIALISREQRVNGESNYCFGEGGAGAYSDGKLYTRSKKRGSVEKILNVLCQHGADNSILVDVHPHIGTDKLPAIIEKIREQIIASGGEVHFETRMENLIVEDNEVKGIETHKGEVFRGKVILATGHSARDVYYMLERQQIRIEAKGLAMGFRIEHPATLIDRIQYHSPQGRGQYLPAAEYSYTVQAGGRGVYSFCMCPGGIIIPAASGDRQVVVNGMSPSNRNSKWSNSGMVVEIHPEDFPEYTKYGNLSLLKLQEELEERCWFEGGSKQTAPAQRMYDFVNSRSSNNLPDTSYSPGVVASDLHSWMPSFIIKRLQEGFALMGKQHQGFLTNEALLIGIESRTSSPVRIVRDKENMCHPDIKGLYPCGEGAGYAGGIVSAAIDGELCASALAQSLREAN